MRACRGLAGEGVFRGECLEVAGEGVSVVGVLWSGGRGRVRCGRGAAGESGSEGRVAEWGEGTRVGESVVRGVSRRVDVSVAK